MSDRPNPGSPEAREQGCKCPVIDNCRGRGYMGISGLFVYSADCPLHWPKGHANPIYVGETPAPPHAE